MCWTGWIFARKALEPQLNQYFPIILEFWFILRSKSCHWAWKKRLHRKIFAKICLFSLQYLRAKLSKTSSPWLGSTDQSKWVCNLQRQSWCWGMRKYKTCYHKPNGFHQRKDRLHWILCLYRVERQRLGDSCLSITL